MKNTKIEYLVGCFVLAGLAAILYLAIQVGGAPRPAAVEARRPLCAHARRACDLPCPTRLVVVASHPADKRGR